MMGIPGVLEKRRLKEGAGLPAPKSGYRRYFYLLWNFFWKLAAVNVLFIVFSLPLVTLPAALCAANRVCIKLIREGYVFLWTEFITEFKASCRKSLLLGFLFGCLLFAAYYLLSLGLTNTMNMYGMLFSALGLALLIPSMLWGGYAFVLTAMLDLPAGTICKNAFSLIMLNGKRALGVLGTEVFMVFTVIALFPVSIVLLGFCWFSLTLYTLCFLINEPVEEYILAPFERAKAENETI